jgi:hypothetical protein
MLPPDVTVKLPLPPKQEESAYLLMTGTVHSLNCTNLLVKEQMIRIWKILIHLLFLVCSDSCLFHANAIMEK